MTYSFLNAKFAEMTNEDDMTTYQSTNSDFTELEGQKPRMSIHAVLGFAMSIASVAALSPIFVVRFSCVTCFSIPLIAILATVLNLSALATIKRSEGRLRGKYMAMSGITIAVVYIISLSSIFCVFAFREIREVRQRAQLSDIDVALELFNSQFGGYPPSDAMDEYGLPYCSAMKLCEALMGRDLKGFHPSSRFKRDGTDDSGTHLYDSNTLEIRKGPYIPTETAHAYRLRDLYKNIGPFDGNEYVLCDVYKNVKHIGTRKRVGMPILYYKANTSRTAHDINDPDNPENIYDYKDNHALIGLGVPGKPGQKHPLYENPRIFYEMTRDYNVAKMSKPQRADTFILLSAGKDGLYGTKDDIANFEIGWKPK